MPDATVATIWSGSAHAALDLDAPASAPEAGRPDLRDSLRRERDAGYLSRMGVVAASAALRSLRIIDTSAPLGAAQLLKMFGSG